MRIKADTYEPEGSGMSSLEDYLKYFLDEEIKPLWPRGWMQARYVNPVMKQTRGSPSFPTLLKGKPIQWCIPPLQTA